MSPLEGLANQIASEARAAANCALPGWRYSVIIPSELFGGEIEKSFAIRSHPSRSAEPTELVRIDTDYLNVKSEVAALNLLLRMELEPFIIGVGLVKAVETAKGIVILAGEEWQRKWLTHQSSVLGKVAPFATA
jgi:hypothetical protein